MQLRSVLATGDGGGHRTNNGPESDLNTHDDLYISHCSAATSKHKSSCSLRSQVRLGQQRPSS